jgi:acetyl-CoA carboxylase carboxyl transferase subunit beta
MPLFRGLTASDPLKFIDSKKYKDRIRSSKSKTKLEEAISVGTGKLEGHKTCIAVFDFSFMGGSMGSVVGEKITRGIEFSMKNKIPFILISASGGARMQEGALSLMQMAKTSAALKKLANLKIPYISVLTDPTTGGVSASVAMLGDVNIAEKGAMIGFAGARVIQQTINQDLPEGFQKAEFLQEHGAVDLIVSRSELKPTIANLLDIFAIPRKKKSKSQTTAENKPLALPY